MTIIAAVCFFALALSNAVYEYTTPIGPLRILVRKTYSIIAFAIVGYLYSRALSASGNARSTLFVAIAVAIYSAYIELGQDVVGSQEVLAWNAIDVACGLIGGFLGRSLARN